MTIISDSPELVVDSILVNNGENIIQTGRLQNYR